MERLPPKKKIPPDPFRVCVRGLNEKTTEDCLLFYLEKFSDVVKEVIRGCDGKALAIFAAEPGNDWQVLFLINKLIILTIIQLNIEFSKWFSSRRSPSLSLLS